MNDLDIAFKLNDQIMTFWQFYVAGAVSIIGWIFSRETAWSKQKRAGVGIAAAIFLLFNIVALSKTIHYLTKILEALNQLLKVL